MDAGTHDIAAGCPTCNGSEFLAVSWMNDPHDTRICTACGTESRRVVTCGAVAFEEAPARASAQSSAVPRLSDPFSGGAAQ